MEVTTPATNLTGSPFNIPEILDMILMKLDAKSIPTSTRFVCKSWNNSWLRFYFKQPKALTPDLIKPEAISKIHSILKTSHNPSVFFSIIRCNWSTLGVQNLISEFGWSLKVLYLAYQSPEVLPILSILFDLCPNLEELKFVICSSIVTLKAFDLENSQFKGRTLPNLKRLTRPDIFEMENREMEMKLFKWIVKASVNLKSLHFISRRSPNLALKTIKEMDEDPENKIKLDELNLDCSCTQEFHPLKMYLGIGMIENLKSLTLNCHQLFPMLEISNILKKLSGSLESLTLHTPYLNYHLVDTVHPDGPNSVEFPYMPKLKILNNFAYRFVQLESSEFLANVPNLEKLIISRNSQCGDIEYDSIDRLLSTLSESMPNLALKELIIMGATNRSETPGIIRQLFPNLSKLYIGVKLNEKLLKEVISNFAGMERLRDLTVAFDFGHGAIQISNVLETVAPTHELAIRYLTIINSGEKCAGDWLVAAIPHLLNQLPKLVSLRLFKFYMEVPTTVRFLEALQSQKNSKTRLEYLQVDPMNEFLI